MTIQCPQCKSEVTASLQFCPQCGFQLSAASQEAVPGSFLTRGKWFVRVVLLAVLATGVFAYLREAFRTYHPVIEKQPVVFQSSGHTIGKIPSTVVQAKTEGPFLVVSLNDILDKKLVRFFDPEGIQTLPLIAYITPDGKLVTAMSISENCRSDDFYLEGDNIHCAHCPSYWNMTSLEAYACCQKFYPDPIPSVVLGDEVRIELESIRNWKSRS